MSGYEAEIRTGVLTDDNNLHTWLQIRHADGTEEAWGSHPEDGSDISNLLSGPGVIKEEVFDKDYSRSSGAIALTERQYVDLMGNIHAQKDDPPEYSLVS